MYLPNAQYIPAPFKQSLKAKATEPIVKPTATLSANPKAAQASNQETPEVKIPAAKPDIVAAESGTKHQTHNDGMETALLMLLLMDGIR